jgi:pimeloyl-ACP methyl ester carboxylesterase
MRRRPHPAASVGCLQPGFSPFHRGGAGPPLVCLHGFLDSWRSWELVLPSLERHHDVLAPTLAGHAGGPALDGPAGEPELLDAVEAAMDSAGFATAHLVGNSLGGWLALQLAARGRARTVVALAPAGGWPRGDRARGELLSFQSTLLDVVREAAPYADAIASSPEGRRRATRHLSERFEHIPAELIAHTTRATAACDAAPALIERAGQADWELDAERIACPVRIVWGTEDHLLPWPAAATRFRDDWLPHADWIELDGVGHCPQLDVPLETAELILGWTAPAPA